MTGIVKGSGWLIMHGGNGKGERLMMNDGRGFKCERGGLLWRGGGKRRKRACYLSI